MLEKLRTASLNFSKYSSMYQCTISSYFVRLPCISRFWIIFSSILCLFHSFLNFTYTKPAILAFLNVFGFKLYYYHIVCLLTFNMLVYLFLFYLYIFQCAILVDFTSTLVGSNGIEPSTSRLSGVRSNHLSYEPILEL